MTNFISEMVDILLSGEDIDSVLEGFSFNSLHNRWHGFQRSNKLDKIVVRASSAPMAASVGSASNPGADFDKESDLSVGSSRVKFSPGKESPSRDIKSREHGTWTGKNVVVKSAIAMKPNKNAVGTTNKSQGLPKLKSPMLTNK